MLSATELRDRVTIEKATVTNTDGIPTETWSRVQANVPAKIVAMKSPAVNQAAQVTGQTWHQVTIRYRDDITSRCRFKIGSRILHIEGPPRRVPETRTEALVMECIEVE